MDSKLKVTVLAGGVGAEREVSIQSGENVADALRVAGLDVVMADISPDDMSALADDSIGVFFVVLHGRFGEDGQLQQILEDRALVYTGSGPTASELAFDKIASKKLFGRIGVNTPTAIEFKADSDVQQIAKQLKRLADKYVVKPITQGSSVGISIIAEPSEAVAEAQKCLVEFGDCMIEEFIAGQQITVGILCGEPLPIIEIRTERDFYDYQAKYIDEQTEYLFDTIDDTALAEKIKAAAVECFNSLGMKDFGRVDFILGDDGVAYVLEANTIPGLTTHSLLPKAAAKAGFSMGDLCVKIIEAALESKKLKSIR